MDLREAELGASHPDVAALASDLADSYIQLSLHDQAEKLLARALKDIVGAYGKDSSKVSSTLNRLAKLYRRNGSLDRAEPLLLRVVELERDAEEPDFAELADACHGLGLLCERTGRMGLAVEYCRRPSRCVRSCSGLKATPSAKR